ncbi:hypothetical protein [Mediterranea sp. An20]|uniref:hypothetical protein n=1 Tax=Mediterranea sp. An20 TaxID=1965586 RepID=UPI001EF58242|nr:hypothetical protein [Mediterranea sp. An20]
MRRTKNVFKEKSISPKNKRRVYKANTQKNTWKIREAKLFNRHLMEKYPEITTKRLTAEIEVASRK